MHLLLKFRENFYARWSWWLLLLTFSLTFFLPERKDVRNLYRLFVALPALLMLSWPVLKVFFVSKPMRWFAVLSLYFALSLLWSAEFKSIDNHLLRILSTWGLAFLLFYIAHFRPELFAQIDKILVAFGLVWAVLLIIDWSSLYQATPHLDRWTVGRGAFHHHRHVGWMVAVLSLLSLHRALHKSSTQYLYILTAGFFFVFLILVQARGGLLVFFAGAMASFLLNFRSRNWRLLAIIGTCVVCVTVVVSILLPDLFHSLVSRGASGRLAIWQNWLSDWQSSSLKMFFGYGLGADSKNVIGNLTVAHYHNFYLNNLFYGGIVGFSLIIGWLSSLIRSIRTNKMFDSPWVPVFCGVLAGFLTDGDRIFSYPDAFTFSFMLPVFCLSFKPGIKVDG